MQLTQQNKAFGIAAFAVAATISVGLFISSRVHAKPKYEPTEVQSLKLQNAQKDVIIQSVSFQQAQNNYQMALTKYTDLATQFKRDNKWPDNVRFDITHMTYCDNIDSQGQCPATSAMPATPTSQPAPAPAAPAKKP